MARPPGSIPTGSIPGWPDEFSSDERLRFARAIGEDVALWWNERIYNKVEMFPAAFAEALCDGLPGDHLYTYEEISPATDMVRLTMSGISGGTDTLWLHGQEIMLAEGFVMETGAFVDEPQQSQGIGKRMALNVYDMALSLGLSRIGLNTAMMGKYFWAQLGFLPDHGSWEFRLKDGIKTRLLSLGRHVDERRRVQVLALARSENPKMIRAIAALRDLVPSDTRKTNDGRPVMIPLGIALLAENPASWYGELDLRDTASCELFERRTGRWKE